MSQRTRRGPRKVSRDDTCKHTYQGYRFIKGIRKLLARLASHKDCANRLLHYDEYATLLLFYFFNANITSLRGLRSSTEFEKVRKKLGIKRTSLGSLSEASNVFDPALLRFHSAQGHRWRGVDCIDEHSEQAPPTAGCNQAR